MDQNEVKYDKLLKIKTTGRDDSRSDQYCYPYEPTAVRGAGTADLLWISGEKESSDRLRMWKRQSGFFSGVAGQMPDHRRGVR